MHELAPQFFHSSVGFGWDTSPMLTRCAALRSWWGGQRARTLLAAVRGCGASGGQRVWGKRRPVGVGRVAAAQTSWTTA
ncbi:hypothetical protein E2562_024487, partial [Oryza meyeriana var. granulata]